MRVIKYVKRMPKKYLLIFAITLAILICVYSYNRYHLFIVDGRYYIIYKGQQESTNPNGLIQEEAPAIYFSSMKEMKEDILKGTFTKEELKELSRFTRDDGGAILVCNLEKLYEPTYPADLNPTVRWHGYYYTWIFDGDISSTSFVMSFNTYPDYPHAFYLWHRSPQSYRRYNGDFIDSVTTTSDRNATVINYTTADNRTMQSVSYKIETGDKTLLVEERHDLTFEKYYVDIYGQQGDKYFQVINIEPTERPSVEWLSQFGLQEYIESPAF